jgi:alanyl-tRNA synthetase
VGVTPDLTQRVRAGDIIKSVTGGKGGGRPDFATGGGNEPEGLGAALQEAYAAVERLLSSEN